MRWQPSSDEIEHLLRLAMEEAELAAEAGDHPYGAILVDPAGAIVATGRNRVNTESDPTSHAESNAIRTACRTLGTLALTGHLLFTNGVPCTMCAATMLATGISAIWYSAPIPASRTMPTLEQMAALMANPPDVSQGVLADEASAQLAKWESS